MAAKFGQCGCKCCLFAYMHCCCYTHTMLMLENMHGLRVWSICCWMLLYYNCMRYWLLHEYYGIESPQLSSTLLNLLILFLSLSLPVRSTAGTSLEIRTESALHCPAYAERIRRNDQGVGDIMMSCREVYCLISI